MLTILVLVGVLTIGVGGLVWVDRRQRRRDALEAQSLTRSVARQAQREIAAADYRSYATRPRKERP